MVGWPTKGIVQPTSGGVPDGPGRRALLGGHSPALCQDSSPPPSAGRRGRVGGDIGGTQVRCPPSLAEVTPAVCARRQEWTGRITDGRVAQRPAHVLQQRTWACPHGPRLLAARPAPPRTVPPMGGAVCLARPSCDGMPCQPGCAPVDEARQRAERRTPGDRQQAGASWAAEVPVETAQERCAEGTGLSWSEQPGQEGAGALRHAWGVLEVSPTAAELAPRVAESAAGTTWRPVVGGASAGALVPTRPAPATGAVAGRRHTRAQRASWPGAGKEAQGLRFSRVERGGSCLG